MKALLIYATYTGGTYEVSQHIASECSKNGLEVLLQEVSEVSRADIAPYDLIIFGSPTWGDGEMHESLAEFIDGNSQVFANKKFVIFGLGDTSYANYCAAVDQLEEFVKKSNGALILPSLKIDSYFFTKERYIPIINEWCRKLISKYVIIHV